MASSGTVFSVSGAVDGFVRNCGGLIHFLPFFAKTQADLDEQKQLCQRAEEQVLTLRKVAINFYVINSR